MPVKKVYFHPQGWAGTRAAAARKIQAVVRRRKKQNLSKKYKLSRPVDTLVKKRIAQSTETNQAGFYFRPYQFTNKISDSPNQRIWQVLPEIPRGTERNDRLGTQLGIVNLNVKGRIYIPAGDNPVLGNDDRAEIYVRLMCLSWKMCHNLADIQQNWNANEQLDDAFFKLGGSATAPQGTYRDMLYPINREVFTVHYDKIIKLQRNLAYFPDPTSSSGAGTQKSASREFNFTVRAKNKKLKYMNEAATLPMNFCPFICAQFAYSDAGPSSVSAVPYCEYLSTMRFKK